MTSNYGSLSVPLFLFSPTFLTMSVGYKLRSVPNKIGWNNIDNDAKQLLDKGYVKIKEIGKYILFE